MSPQLYWLPHPPDWRNQLRALSESGRWSRREIAALIDSRLDFVGTNMLDAVVRKLSLDEPPAELLGKPERLALLGSATMAHLHPGIRVASLRRQVWMTTYEAAYGQYHHELTDRESGLYRFRPTAVLFSFDARHVTQGFHAAQDAASARSGLEDVLSRIRHCWRLAREAFGCKVLQQTVLNVMPPLMGSSEHRLGGSRHRAVDAINAGLRELADQENVDLVSVDQHATHWGVAAWHDESLWDRSKQEITPAAAPMYGELVARVLAARQGRSKKCLVLDLDNTIWGGVVGDDGMEGLEIGQGSALGEGFAAVQTYARELSRLGVILAVCSKNDERNALEPFERNPDMVLKRPDIACFRANWDDKPTNIRAIAAQLHIGLDSLVFIDDSPFERALVRQELPMVAVPEIPEDPALVPRCIADAGYFESVSVTDEDRARTGQYQENRARESLKEQSTDLDSYLRGLEMELVWKRFDAVGLGRTVQLINKTNQFNLTTRRYSEEDVGRIIDDPRSMGLQLRLHDRFGDNGIIAVVIGRMAEDRSMLIDTWLMSCRVLGRQVETATLNVLASEAQRMGSERLIGEFIPSQKNAMVRDHYPNLGFTTIGPEGTCGRYALELARFHPRHSCITLREG